ncbi:unnamed protein product [Rotaria magnacalcarata]|uniref:A-kinase anchor protein 14 n=1 Tax=Rotaria magnacalcarata TaxID=392030 RepID=A0A816PDS7_9BILA|nr:unnamed protein product [Rotaria magnacalcarata]CAF1542739.1 unnamed protein product [Rotaria magnacalcarata]CAF2047289.1 unnamed protein product [Rotaria magnacalcarata]CAF2086245.1 unnamed protein product [Rotaria magnacalcarata]CAF2113403.1 unnamed protein product [Rotaria magnacalcarata]
MTGNNADLPLSLVQSEDYDLLAFEAQRIVDQVLSQSLLHVNNTLDSNLDENKNNQERGRFKELENNEWQNKRQGQTAVKWPTIAEFTNEHVGIEKITEYIEKEWKTAPGGQDACWLYAIDFLEKKSLEFNDLYIYRVRYSIPTRRQPIPRQTVSIYFTLDVSKIKPKNTSIQVSFVLETMRLIHHPDQFRFRQTWLENIILLKEKMTNGIEF